MTQRNWYNKNTEAVLLKNQDWEKNINLYLSEEGPSKPRMGTAKALIEISSLQNKE